LPVEIQGIRIPSEEQSIVIVSLTRSSAVAKRPRYAPCGYKFGCQSKSLKVIRSYSVE